MSGIVFLKTKNMPEIRKFYEERVGMQLWLQQAHCIILKHGNLVLGFCESEESDIPGCYTFFYETKEEIDRRYEEFKDCAEDEPKVTEEYQIYHFFAKDPEGRKVEFQQFLHHLEPYCDAEELLLKRRSIRQFEDTEITYELLEKIFENCRFAPTSRNHQPCYFVVIRDDEKKKKLAHIRESGAGPIERAPVAVAICVDTSKTKRVTDDGHIASYHLCLAAKAHGLGTCWIGGMDLDEVKEILGIPKEHFVSTVTPLGFPAENPEPKVRKYVNEIYKII